MTLATTIQSFNPGQIISPAMQYALPFFQSSTHLIISNHALKVGWHRAVGILTIQFANEVLIS